MDIPTEELIEPTEPLKLTDIKSILSVLVDIISGLKKDISRCIMERRERMLREPINMEDSDSEFDECIEDLLENNNNFKNTITDKLLKIRKEVLILNMENTRLKEDNNMLKEQILGNVFNFTDCIFHSDVNMS